MVEVFITDEFEEWYSKLDKRHHKAVDAAILIMPTSAPTGIETEARKRLVRDWQTGRPLQVPTGIETGARAMTAVPPCRPLQGH